MRKLTKKDKEFLKKIGYLEEDFNQIEEANYKYYTEDDQRISEEEALKKLGRDRWLRKEAIETLLRDNFKVFVDYEEVSLTEDSETKKLRPKPEGIEIENGGDNDPLKGVDFK